MRRARTVGALFVSRVPDSSPGAILPVLRRLPHPHGAAHPVLDALGVLPRALLAVVSDEDRLA